jgi:nucleotide-binding universal stress UspA family protein
MYRKIVVPLDGSKLAECILPHVEELAKGCGTEEVVLLSVTEHLTGYKRQTGQTFAAEPLPPAQPVVQVPMGVGKKQQQARRYLSRIAKRIGKKLDTRGINVRTDVLLGNPAEEIINFVMQNNGDLIAIVSHGRSGFSRWAHSVGAFGGVADKVLRASTVPVLVVTPAVAEPGT